MSHLCKRGLVGGLVLAILAMASPLLAKEKSEDELIQDLSSPKDKVVTDAMLHLEKQFPTSTKAFPIMKKMLTDPRPEVRRKAARVFGALHADLDETDLKNIAALLKASDPKEVEDGLKALRGLKAQSTVPEILPCLKNSDPFVIRDACRTLAVLGDKSVIPSIEPLLTHAIPAVQKDAKDAIFQLNSKG